MSIVDRKNIDIQLRKIEALYLAALGTSPDPFLPLFYAKLYIIEMCGWIEHSLDEILVAGYLDRYKIASLEIKREWVDKNYSFDYDSYKRMNMNVVGIKAFLVVQSALERKLDSGKTFPSFSEFKGALAILQKTRNKIAHTSVNGVTTSINAPSLLKSDFEKVYIGLKILENEISKL